MTRHSPAQQKDYENAQDGAEAVLAAKAERVTAAQLEQEALAKADGASQKLKFYAQANNDGGLAAEQTRLQALR